MCIGHDDTIDFCHSDRLSGVFLVTATKYKHKLFKEMPGNMVNIAKLFIAKMGTVVIFMYAFECSFYLQGQSHCGHDQSFITRLPDVFMIINIIKTKEMAVNIPE